MPASPPEPVVSLGQPPRWPSTFTTSGVFGGGEGANPGARVALGVHHPVGSPVVGFGLDAEAYGTTGGADATGGLRLLGAARAVNLAAGLDWDVRARNAVFLLSWTTATRRGGLLGNGTSLRVDWLPARPRAFAVGLTVPVGQPHAGRTRPFRTGVTLPTPAPVTADARAAVPPASADALEAVREAAGLLRLYTSVFDEQGGGSPAATRAAFRRRMERLRDTLGATAPRYPEGRSAAQAQRVYDAELGRAFAAAAGDDAVGAAVRTRMRAGLLDHVVLPYDTLFGRAKVGRRDLAGLTSAAQASFARWLRDSSTVPVARRPSVLAVHARWLAIVDEVHHTLADQWGDSRRVWLPLQLAVAPDDYDEQAEVDTLLARAAGRPFTDRNAITLLQSTDLPAEFARSVSLARDYHVLWVHDFAGRRKSGAMDRLGYRVVADVYFPALTRAVQRYDSTGRFTTFHVFLDQNFYEPNDGRLWMTVLEDPLGAAVRLPKGNAADEAHLRARQQELRAAVTASARLRADAARAGGARWLRRTVKVHVSITQPSDFTFRSRRILPPVPFLPDNLMRDHRKLAFYDLTEAEPYRGAMVLGGAGIGEHYASPTWDDRGVVLRGPATLEARAAARRLLRLNGIADARIPVALRDATGAGPPAGPPGDGRAYDVRALQVHNEPGFGPKQSSVARAMLYALAPRGSVIVVPDPLWVGAEWAGMLTGAALRGCRVFVIAPSVANSPNTQGIALAQSADVLARLLTIQAVFGDQIARAGGELRVGIYAATEDVNDVAQQAREVRAGMDRAPWLRTLIPFDSAAIAVLDTVAPLLEHAGYRAVAPGRDLAPRPPKLHTKTQLVAAPGALAALARQPQWAEVFGRGLLARARQTSANADPGGLPAVYAEFGLGGPAAALGRAYVAARSADERRRVSFYYATGTQNQDPRGMMLDGEATLVISGDEAGGALPDVYFLMARTTWITRHAELDRHLRPYGRLTRWIARYVRSVL